MWKWKHRSVVECSGLVLGNVNQVLARALNANAEVLRECAKKVDELHVELEELKRKLEVYEKNGGAV